MTAGSASGGTARCPHAARVRSAFDGPVGAASLPTSRPSAVRSAKRCTRKGTRSFANGGNWAVSA